MSWSTPALVLALGIRSLKPRELPGAFARVASSQASYRTPPSSQASLMGLKNRYTMIRSWSESFEFALALTGKVPIEGYI